VNDGQPSEKTVSITKLLLGGWMTEKLKALDRNALRRKKLIFVLFIDIYVTV
jgi:hypothetical protein